MTTPDETPEHGYTISAFGELNMTVENTKKKLEDNLAILYDINAHLHTMKRHLRISKNCIYQLSFKRSWANTRPVINVYRCMIMQTDYRLTDGYINAFVVHANAIVTKITMPNQFDKFHPL